MASPRVIDFLSQLEFVMIPDTLSRSLLQLTPFEVITSSATLQLMSSLSRATGAARRSMFSPPRSLIGLSQDRAALKRETMSGGFSTASKIVCSDQRYPSPAEHKALNLTFPGREWRRD